MITLRCWRCCKIPVNKLRKAPDGKDYCSPECRDARAADTIEQALIGRLAPRPSLNYDGNASIRMLQPRRRP